MKSTLARTCTMALATAVAASGCADVKPIPAVPHVDVSRYMGRWYVIAAIPTFLEKHDYDAVETYTLRPDGRIDTVFHHREGGFDAPVKTLHSVATVHPGSDNARWGVQFIWPFKSEYVIVALKDDYSEVMVGRSKRDHLWIMARTPNMPQADYDAMLQRARQLGYSLDGLRKVPQRWPDDAH